MLPDATVGVLEGYAAEAPPAPAVLVMTRGSVLDAPPGPVGAVVLPDIDGQLRRPTLDAAEDTLRLSMQVARWATGSHPDAGRGTRVPDRERSAVVVVQTREPDHPAVQALVRWDPGGFWRQEAVARAELRFPPAAYALRVDVPAAHAERVREELATTLPADDGLLGPVPTGARVGFLVKSEDRIGTLAAMRSPRRAWSQDDLDVRVDVDPVDAAL